MKRMHAVWMAMAMAGCTDSSAPDEPGGLEIRPANSAPVRGTDIVCTKLVATATTPCDNDAGAAFLSARALGETGTRFELSRNPGPERIQAEITLEHADHKLSAVGSTVALGIVRSPPDLALEGWIEPQATSFDATGRNAGRFSMTFEWGTVSGTYDSDD